MSFARSLLLLGGAALAFALVALLYQASPDASDLSVRIAPGLPFRITQPTTLVAGQMNRITWDSSPTQYAGENIASCPTTGPATLNRNCEVWLYYTPNTGEANVYVPPHAALGQRRLVLTAWDKQGNYILPNVTSAVPVQVVAGGSGPISIVADPAPSVAPSAQPSSPPGPLPLPSLPAPPNPTPSAPNATAEATPQLWLATVNNAQTITFGVTDVPSTLEATCFRVAVNGVAVSATSQGSLPICR